MSNESQGFPVRTIAECNAMLTAPGQRLETEEIEINGVQHTVYKNAPKSLREIVSNTRELKDREYLVYADERVTFGMLHKATAHIGKALLEKFGVERGDRVAVAARNFPQWPPAFYGAVSVGAIGTLLNSWWTGEELHYGLEDSGAKVAIVDPQRLELIRPHLDSLPNLKHIVVMRGGKGDADPRVTSLEDIIGDVSAWNDLEDIDLPGEELEPDVDATILYTSGTTGKPKGAIGTHRACVTNLFHSLGCQARAFLRKGETPPVNDPAGPDQKVTLLSIPMFHATGCFANVVAATMRGDKLVTMYKWDPVEAMELIQAEGITTFGGVPAIAWQLLEHPERDKYDLSSIQTVAYGGAPAASDLVTTIKKTFPDGAVSNGWGMTETCATSTLNFGMDYEVRPESAGAAGPASEIKIVDAEGNALPPGGVGEMWYKGANNCRAYWNKPEATAKTFVDGWVVTGDIAKLDEEGFLYLLDRAKDMLIRGGENIYCIEVESVLYDLPEVMDAAVVGIPHKVLGEEVGAVVQVKPGESLDEQKIIDFCKGELAGYKVPVQVKLQTEPLPRNANGKILKNELRDMFEPTDA